MVNVSNNDLSKKALDIAEIIKLSSNIGDIGIATDFSKNMLRNPVQDRHPLVVWLLNTAMSARMRNANRQGLAQIHKDADTNDWVLLMPYTVGTLPPEDTSNACCWVPLDIAKCGGKVPLKLLCLKDCDSIFDYLVNESRYAGSNDLVGYFLRQGESVKDARKRMARMSMSFFTAYNIILGTSTAGTGILKPFHGLLEVMENAAVIKISGTNILGAFDSLYCRLQVLTGGNYVIAVHPLTYQGIDSAVVPGRFNSLPSGWSRNGSELRFHDMRFIQDKTIPVDLTAGTGEAWLLDGDTTGVYMATDLAPTDRFIRHGFTSTDDPSKGCASECQFYYNFGAVFNNNPNRLAMITDIPLSANCIGNALQGLDGLVKPDTLVPMV